jgi:hypothetical protein
MRVWRLIMNQQKPVFLVSKAIIIEPKDPDGYYDSELQLNTVSKTDKTPLVLSGEPKPTHSKTMQRPGDDDPDPGQRRCY